MRSPSHPRLVAKGTRAQLGSDRPAVRAIVYAPDPLRAEWIEHELAREHIVIQTGRGVAGIVAALLDDPPPRPQILVADFEHLSAAAIVELHAVRERGWTGTVIAVGKLEPAFRRSLGVTHVLERVAVDDLRRAVRELGFEAQTRRIPTLP